MANFDETVRVNDWPIKFSSRLTDGRPAVPRPTNDLMTGIRHLRGSSFSLLSSRIVFLLLAIGGQHRRKTKRGNGRRVTMSKIGRSSRQGSLLTPSSVAGNYVGRNKFSSTNRAACQPIRSR